MSLVDAFASPSWLLALGFVPLVLVVFSITDRAKRRRIQELVGSRGSFVPVRHLGAGQRRRRFLLVGGLGFALLAAAQPQWGRKESSASEDRGRLLVCLDVSRSMLATDVRPSRMESAKQSLQRLLDHAPGLQLGLIAFAGDARLVIPLTSDGITFSQLLEWVDPWSVHRGGTDLGAALTLARDTLEQESGATGVLLMTDGEDLEGQGLAVAQEFHQRGIPVHCMGYGTRLGSKIAIEGDDGSAYLRDRTGNDVVSALDWDSLQAISEAGGGVSLQGDMTHNEITELYDHHILPHAQRLTKKQGDSIVERENRYQWPLLIAVLLWTLSRLPRKSLAGSGKPARTAMDATKKSWQPNARPSASSGVSSAGPPLANAFTPPNGSADAFHESKPRTRFLATAVVVTALAGDSNLRLLGTTAYQEARYEDSREHWSQAANQNPKVAELRFNAALAAVRAGDWKSADQWLKEIEPDGDRAFETARLFLAGNLSYLRAKHAEVLASQPEAEPFVWDEAIRHARDAGGHWQRAAMRDPTSSAARRNAERTVLLIRDLERKKAEAEKPRRKPAPQPRPLPAPMPDTSRDPGPGPTPGSEPPPPLQLSPEEIERLLKSLEDQEDAKRKLRQGRRPEAVVERDW